MTNSSYVHLSSSRAQSTNTKLSNFFRYIAHKASSYLLSLLSSPSSNLSLTPSKALDKIYSPLPAPTEHSESILLLQKSQVEKLTEEFGMDFEERKELERAVGQAEERLRQGRKGDEETLVKEGKVVKEGIKEKREERKN